MKVVFIKDHPSGVKKGTETEVRPAIAEMWQEQGYIDSKELKKISKSVSKEDAEVIAEIKAEESATKKKESK